MSGPTRQAGLHLFVSAMAALTGGFVAVALIFGGHSPPARRRSPRRPAPSPPSSNRTSGPRPGHSGGGRPRAQCQRVWASMVLVVIFGLGPIVWAGRSGRDGIR